MTRDETILLWRTCEESRAAAIATGKADQAAHEEAKAVWNAWAENMLERQELLKKSSLWQSKNLEAHISGIKKAENEETSKWCSDSEIHFDAFRFENNADFSGFIFPGDTFFGRGLSVDLQNLESASFAKKAFFRHAQFTGLAWFRGVHFERDTIFSEAIFRGLTSFEDARFAHAVWFSHSQFEGRATFSGAHFDNYGDFFGTTFLSEADFRSTQIAGELSFVRTDFSSVPRFNQANFHQAPDLDDISFPLPRFWGGNKADAAKYRALRRLANQNHDHENEAKAFKGEIRSKRNIEHKLWHGAFWFGIAYDMLSDFGRSLMRPVYVWLLSLVIFTGAYLLDSGKSTNFSRRCPLAEAGSASMLQSAFILSWGNTLPLVSGNSKSDEVAHACLYESFAFGDSVLQSVQKIWSAVLIFLFLLGIRSQFKMK